MYGCVSPGVTESNSLHCCCRLHEEIMAVGGARLKPQQEMVDKLVKEIDDANATVTRATVGIKTNER